MNLKKTLRILAACAILAGGAFSLTSCSEEAELRELEKEAERLEKEADKAAAELEAEIDKAVKTLE